MATELVGQTSRQLHLGNVGTQHNGRKYYCVISNASGSVPVHVPPLTVWHPAAKDYFDRVSDAGGDFASPSFTALETQRRINECFIQLHDTGVWDAIAELYLMAGVNFAGLPAKAKYVSVPNITWYSLVSGDYTPAGSATIGLQGGAGKWGNTQQTAFSGIGPNIGLGACVTVRGLEDNTGVLLGNGGVSGDNTVTLWEGTGSRYGTRLKSSNHIYTIDDREGATTHQRISESHVIAVTPNDVEPSPVAAAAGTVTDSSNFQIFRRSGTTYYRGRAMAVWVLDGATRQQIIDLHAAITALRDALQ